jgi:hypothetical protein
MNETESTRGSAYDLEVSNETKGAHDYVEGESKVASLGTHPRTVVSEGVKMGRKQDELDVTGTSTRGRADSLRIPTSFKRLTVLIVAVVLALPLVVLAVIPARAGAQDTTLTTAHAALRLPDIRMGPLQDLRVRKSPEGRRLLRFSALMVNVGRGPFELQGQRPDTNTAEMTVTQRVLNNAGDYRSLPTTARMFYSGDGHDHWHVKDLQRYTLKRLGNSSQVRESPKQGFCVYDYVYYNLTLRGAPSSKQYREANTCGELEDEEALQVDMGLSVGWADKYAHFLPYQWIDITGLRSGTYRLRAVTDWKNEFKESRESNNFTWVKIKLKGNKVRVLREGPVARYCGRGQWC